MLRQLVRDDLGVVDGIRIAISYAMELSWVRASRFAATWVASFAQGLEIA